MRKAENYSLMQKETYLDKGALLPPVSPSQQSRSLSFSSLTYHLTKALIVPLQMAWKALKEFNKAQNTSWLIFAHQKPHIQMEFLNKWCY